MSVRGVTLASMTETPPPQQPYGQQPPPGYYQGPPPKKKHTLRNVLLAVVLLFVLVVGGCLALVGTAANEVGKAIEEGKTEVGGTDNPLEIQPGKAFDVRGFKYAAGWTLKGDQFGNYAEIKGLKVTNERDDRDSALVEIKMWRGSEVLALVDCTTEPIAPNTTVTLSCSSGDKMPKNYDKVTINDAF